MTSQRPGRRKPGPPKGYGSKFTKVIGEHICQRLSEGVPLMQICRDRGIAWRTVFHWVEDRPDFAEAYQRARDLGMDAIAEECLQIADDGRNDFVKRELGEGVEVEVFNGEHVQRSKLRIETRLKLLAKWNPKKWGDRITHAGDPAAPVALVLNGSDVHG